MSLVTVSSQAFPLFELPQDLIRFISSLLSSTEQFLLLKTARRFWSYVDLPMLHILAAMNLREFSIVFFCHLFQVGAVHAGGENKHLTLNFINPVSIPCNNFQLKLRIQKEKGYIQQKAKPFIYENEVSTIVEYPSASEDVGRIEEKRLFETATTVWVCALHS